MADPYTDFDNWDSQRFRYEQRRPKCNECRQPIMDEYKYIAFRDVYCESCFDELFKHETDDELIYCPVCGRPMNENCYIISEEIYCEECIESDFKVEIEED